MVKTNVMFLLIFLLYSSLAMAQLREPEFIGEALVLNDDSTTISLEREIADFTSGISLSANSWNALSLELRGGQALNRFSAVETLKIIVRANDNNSDPVSIISIYKLNSKKKKREFILSENNSGTLMKSRTNSKDLVRFKGEKFGTNSYLIELLNLEPGEYGIIVSNPNNRDEKRTVVSCFGVD